MVTETNSTSGNAALTRGVPHKKECECAECKLKRSKENKKIESGSMKQLGRIRESVAPVSGEGVGRRFRVTLLTEGMGNEADCFYYTKEALASCVPLYEGAPARANHPKKSDEVEQPEGNVLHTFGYYEKVGLNILPAGDGRTTLDADLVVVDGPAFEKERALLLEAVIYKTAHPDKDFVGLSINADGDFDTTTIEQFLQTEPIPPGAKTKLLEAAAKGIVTLYPVRLMTSAVSCDLVTVAGAGGKVNTILESEREKMGKKQEDMEGKKEGKKEGQAPEGGAGPEAAGAGSTKPEDGSPDGTHPDAAQDEELIMSLMKKYLGDGFSDDDKSMAKEAYQNALEAYGGDHESAMKCAGENLKMAKHMQAKQAKEAKGMDPQGSDPTAPAASSATASQVPKDQQKAESGFGVKESAKPSKGNDDMIAKLSGQVAALQSKVDAYELEKHIDKVCRESKLPRAATTKFRESCLKGVKSTKEVDEKLSVFKEAFGLGGEAHPDFVMSAERGTSESGSGFTAGDCLDN